MNACAKRWDHIRTECKNSNTLSNTVWPGPCECAYFANDLPCFDDQALCVRPVYYSHIEANSTFTGRTSLDPSPSMVP
jgi:hypothetical protein